MKQLSTLSLSTISSLLLDLNGSTENEKRGIWVDVQNSSENDDLFRSLWKL